jgi:predicted transcriptional regulator
MRRVNLFFAILLASLITLTILIVAGMYVFTAAQQSPSSWMNGMWGNMGGMMNGNSPVVQNPALPYFGVAFLVLIGVAVVGVVGLAYYVALPEIKTGTAPVICEPGPPSNVNVEQDQKPACTPLESIVKTLSDEERKIIEVLNAHEGKYLQKYIRIETGLSRLQTHRIVARLAERGIVNLEKTGNTNQVLLADWLRKSRHLLRSE